MYDKYDFNVFTIILKVFVNSEPTINFLTFSRIFYKDLPEILSLA